MNYNSRGGCDCVDLLSFFSRSQLIRPGNEDRKSPPVMYGSKNKMSVADSLASNVGSRLTGFQCRGNEIHASNLLHRISFELAYLTTGNWAITMNFPGRKEFMEPPGFHYTFTFDILMVRVFSIGMLGSKTFFFVSSFWSF